ncbi:hypothetical protein [Celerinatantimonas diazotrophica]|uniref:Uncharacterized protein n=1 Tax=Celerinatantimonas diazotrophica TaxID=412034 RepID=A0A4R1K157_9GAMM|nr:hypothetical protein [Celerinatantimonas diazotrophica]TCK57610.1 hypothetical protein EV690_1298 [Celerinatantimonas diazotrophica]CAG9298328.1 hypothetical protein CEDIAZO_03528 [Celerinatantimonas diazotrophica]
MANHLPPLQLTMRIEPGCLGPDGVEHVEQFCQFALEPFNRLGGQALQWTLIPRYDKQLPEIEYGLGQHRLSYAQAKRYLEHWSLNLDEEEEHISELLSELIDQFWQR